MNRNNLWKFIFVVVVIVWAVYEIYPPGGRDLIQHFSQRAVNRDATFTNIVEQAQQMQAELPGRTYGNLFDAAGTNDLTRYFPFFEAQTQLNTKSYILNRLQREAAGRVRLGLDLQGGTSFLVEMDTNALVSIETVTNQLGQVESITNAVAGDDVEGAISHAVEVLRKRVDRFGVAEPVIQPAGDNRILIQLPGLSQADQESAKEQIQRAAFLEFRLVHPRSDEMLAQGLIEPGYEIKQEEVRAPDGTRSLRSYLVKKKPERGLTGAHVRNAMVIRGNLGEPKIAFTLDSKGADIFGDVTRQNVGRQLAIILDGQLYSAPVINSPIETGSGEITGRFTAQEAFELANVLENPLRAPLKIIESREVDPTLGKDSIESGVRAALIGIIAVSVFMLVYYLLAGLVANVALMLNILILLGVMCSIGTTLTMPGIAGIVLTIGMAIDANVLIFERIREELDAGKSMRGALAAGYNKAFGTIFDTNLTTLISSVILIFMGTGPVKGFGVTLTIGVCVSMFTALVVTRLVFDFLLARNILKSLPMLRVVRGTKINFMRWAVPAFAASWLLILVGNGYGLFVRGADVLGVEFVGGEAMTVGFNQEHKIEVDKLRAVAERASGSGVLVNYQHNISTGEDTLRITARLGNDGQEGQGVSEKILSELRKEFPQANFGGDLGKPLSVDRVGPTVGKEIQRTAVLASLLAMFGILIYVAFRYEFSFAVGAVVAILHDILMTAGWYFLAGHQMNATTVAAFLTIIGFSINDTIVIFDRIREDLKLGMRGSFVEIMNKALNQTLSRTIITSGTTFLATLTLYIFGGGVINDFAFCFLIGILTGTYSSIYIACFIVLRWHKGQRPAIGASAQMTMESVAQARG